jgi:UDP-glucose 4-epimerase
LVKADLSNQEALVAVLRDLQIKAVIHMAAFIEVGESVQDPLRYYKNNVGGSLSILEAMVECNIEHLIFSSTAAVYGEPEVIPIPETHATNATSPYGKSKLMVEHAISDVEAVTPLRAVRLRFFNAS